MRGRQGGLGAARSSTRRAFLRTTGHAAVATGFGLTAFVRRPGARSATLRIAQWNHIVPEFDEWFDKTFTKAWGARNGVTVVVDHYPASELRTRAASEVAAQHGHDLFGFLDSPAGYADQVVPLDEIVAECERRFGRLAGLVHKGTFNPKTTRYFACSDFWVPALLHYRTDWWTGVGIRPDTWEDVREGARKIRETAGAPAGFGLAPEPVTNMVLRGLLWSYGATEQDEGGRVTIYSKATIDAIKLMTTIFRESMTPEVFMWEPSSNTRFYVWGTGSIIQKGISAIRTAEHQNPEVARRTALAPPAAGPKARLGAATVLHCYVIWKFAENPELAKQFLIDLIGAYTEAFRASEFYNFPSFGTSVRHLRRTLAADTHRPGRYALLADADQWSAGPGHPGYWTPAVEEVVHRAVIPRMFARVARGEHGAEESARRAEAEMAHIFAKWAG